MPVCAETLNCTTHGPGRNRPGPCPFPRPDILAGLLLAGLLAGLLLVGLLAGLLLVERTGTMWILADVVFDAEAVAVVGAVVSGLCGAVYVVWSRYEKDRRETIDDLRRQRDALLRRFLELDMEHQIPHEIRSADVERSRPIRDS